MGEVMSYPPRNMRGRASSAASPHTPLLPDPELAVSPGHWALAEPVPGVEQESWAVTYMDVLTLMLALLVVLVAYMRLGQDDDRIASRAPHAQTAGNTAQPNAGLAGARRDPAPALLALLAPPSPQATAEVLFGVPDAAATLSSQTAALRAAPGPAATTAATTMVAGMETAAPARAVEPPAGDEAAPAAAPAHAIAEPAPLPAEPPVAAADVHEGATPAVVELAKAEQMTDAPRDDDPIPHLRLPASADDPPVQHEAASADDPPVPHEAASADDLAAQREASMHGLPVQREVASAHASADAAAQEASAAGLATDAPASAVSDAEPPQWIGRPVAQRTRLLDTLGNSALRERLEVTATPGTVNLEISDEILFVAGSAELSAAGLTLLDEIAGLMSSGSYAVSVEGHTDDVPIHTLRYPSNWELSAARASNVTRHLIAHGVDSARLRAVGYADTRPRADNRSAAGRARNRRVSLVLHVPLTDPERDETPSVPLQRMRFDAAFPSSRQPSAGRRG